MSDLIRALTAVGCGVVVAGCGRPPAALPPATKPAASAPSAPAGERAEHPAYTRWASHPPGTTVVMREVTTAPRTATETTTTYALKSVTAEVVLVDVSGDIVLPDGTRQSNPPQEFKYSRWATVPAGKSVGQLGRPPGTVEEADDTIDVLGKPTPARRYLSRGRVEAGDTETRTWVADGVPGGLVKTVHRIPAIDKTVTAELVEVRRPPATP